MGYRFVRMIGSGLAEVTTPQGRTVRVAVPSGSNFRSGQEVTPTFDKCCQPTGLVLPTPSSNQLKPFKDVLQPRRVSTTRQTVKASIGISSLVWTATLEYRFEREKSFKLFQKIQSSYPQAYLISEDWLPTPVTFSSIRLQAIDEYLFNHLFTAYNSGKRGLYLPESYQRHLEPVTGAFTLVSGFTATGFIYDYTTFSYIYQPLGLAPRIETINQLINNGTNIKTLAEGEGVITYLNNFFPNREKRDLTVWEVDINVNRKNALREILKAPETLINIFGQEFTIRVYDYETNLAKLPLLKPDVEPTIDDVFNLVVAMLSANNNPHLETYVISPITPN